MKKLLFALGVLGIVGGGIFGEAMVAKAVSPTLSLYATGNGDNVQVTVNGDANSGVTLYYARTGYGSILQSQYLGVTNQNGYFSTTVSTSGYNMTPGGSVYVVVNGQQSANVAWPYGNTSGSISLSQNNVTVAVGQSTNITIYGGYAPYTMYQSTNNIFQSVTAGNTLTITGLATGSGSLQVCSSGSTGCATLYVTVNNTSNCQYGNCYNTQAPITFSQNTINWASGQSMNISIYGGSSSYYIAYNSNSNGVSANINGTTMNISGLANGTTVIVVCSSSTNCSALTVTVGTNYYPTPTPYPGNYTYCASEKGYCSFSGTRTVQYGANGSYYYRTFTNGVSCNNAVFGDPIFGVVKQCGIN